MNIPILKIYFPKQFLFVDLRNCTGKRNTMPNSSEYAGGGLHCNIMPKIFVGVEGKYLWTDKAKLRDEVNGIPLEANFKMDGIIATAVIGMRF
jgi:hypothetical protein